MNLLTELVLVARCNQLSIRAGEWNIANLGEHVARCHDEGGEDSACSPCPLVLNDGGDESEQGEEASKSSRVGRPASPVEGLGVWDRDGCVAG